MIPLVDSDMEADVSVRKY